MMCCRTLDALAVSSHPLVVAVAFFIEVRGYAHSTSGAEDLSHWSNGMDLEAYVLALCIEAFWNTPKIEKGNKILK